jgi:SNF2 family DNA or RNA helicase
MSTVESTKPVFAEISEDGKHIEVYFKPQPKYLDAMHRLNGRFLNSDKAELPHWELNLEFENARQLVIFIGRDNIEVGEALLAWGEYEKNLIEAVDEVFANEDAELPKLKKALPEFNKALRPYQRQAVKYVSLVDHPLIADQPGIGKTLETIAGVFESGLDNGPCLVVTPLKSIEPVWLYELKKWTDSPVLYVDEKSGRGAREVLLRQCQLMMELGKPFWLLINPEMARMKKLDPKGELTKDNLEAAYPELFDITWNVIIADEVHKKGLRNPRSLTSAALRRLPIADNGKRIALSGTPMGGHPINLFGILYWLHPERFSSKWKWANRWLDVSSNGYGSVVGDVKEGLEDDFDAHLRSVVIRRTKEEVLKELPPKDRHDLWCPMTKAQEEQYKRFAAMAQIELGDETLTATSVLAIYTRLKQFASAKCKFSADGKLVPTTESGKLDVLEQKLEELGIIVEDEDDRTDAQAVIFSQFAEMADMVYEWLKGKGVNVIKMAGGKTRDADDKRMTSDQFTKSFQNGEAQVCVMTTDSGGVSITLDRADTVFILDEKWNPDDQEQAEDRVHRASRIHQVTVYYLHSTGTLEEYIKSVTDAKGRLNKKILDERRLRLF